MLARRVASLLAVCALAAGALAPAHSGESTGREESVLGDLVLAEGVDLPSTARPEEKRFIRSLVEAAGAARKAAKLVIDYPLDESVFPPEMVAPTFLWHDSAQGSNVWLIDVALTGGAAHIYVLARSAPAPPAEIDPACLGETNALYRPTKYQASAKNWLPGAEAWAAIKQGSLDAPATVTIFGARAADPGKVLSSGRITIRTSKDPVGAPIFYRDVPLMPSQTKEGVIKPLAKHALPLVAWRLKDISRPDSRLVLKDMPTCANCHSFSADGKTLGMDMDGPDGDKGAYAIAPIRAEMAITHDEVITWNAFQGKPEGHRTIGFLSQISPDGQYAVTTLNEEVYVANFTNYKFLQVFYPTRGILAYYSVKTEEMKALPGADDPNYVHCDGVWTPDGKTIVFARAEAKDAYIKGKERAAYPNDPAETPMKYDLYRMPFNDGRGGTPVPIEGASDNGMSNTFPKVSPDGKYIVFVKCANGQLMRPDGRLWIVPTEGGQAREMECNTTLMNSWHSFSPNGRWMVFSSKVNTPYTQMFLTHLDEEGRSTPPILIPNATAANRAVNIPEFVNIPYEGLLSISAPALDYWRHVNRGGEFFEKGRFEEAISEFRAALQMRPEEAGIHNDLAGALVRVDRTAEGIVHLRKAVELNPDFFSARYNLSFLLFCEGDDQAGIEHYKIASRIQARVLPLKSGFAKGIASTLKGQPPQTAAFCARALQRNPDDLTALFALACLRAAAKDPGLRNGGEAVQLAKQASALTQFQAPETLDVLAGAYAEAGRFKEAVRMAEFTVWLACNSERKTLVPGAQQRLELYRQGKPFRRAN